jgi:hypothetical protein
MGGTKAGEKRQAYRIGRQRAMPVWEEGAVVGRELSVASCQSYDGLPSPSRPVRRPRRLPARVAGECGGVDRVWAKGPAIGFVELGRAVATD